MKHLPLALLALVLVALVVSGLAPADRITWFMEVIWVVAAIPLILFTWKHFPLTPLLCVLLAVHALILILGGHYTYAKVPLGFWLQDMFELSRNHYDRLGHFAQGFVPAILAREVLLRRSPLRPGRWLFYLVASICLAFSAFFEMIEWWAALLMGAGADAFLATQGDIWDTQWDMCMALIGAVMAQVLLSRLHDAQLRRLATIQRVAGSTGHE